MTQDALTEAIELHRRRLHERSRPGDSERLCELAPALEEALESEPDDERYAWGVLSLVKPMAGASRAHELDTYLRVALGRAQLETTRTRVAIAMGQYFLWYHQPQESLDMLEAHAPDDEDAALWLPYAYVRAIALRRLERWEDAREVLLEALRLARRNAFARHHCLLLNALGNLEFKQGRYETALQAWDEAMILIRDRLRDRIPELHAPMMIGQCICLLGLRRYEEAAARLEEVAQHAAAEDDHEHRWYAHANRIYVALYANDLETARAMIEASPSLYEVSNRTLGMLALQEQRFLLALLSAPPTLEDLLPLEREARVFPDRSFVQNRARLYACVLKRTTEDFPAFLPNETISEQVWAMLRARIQRDHDAPWPPDTPTLNAVERALLALLDETPMLLARDDFREVSVDEGHTWIDLGTRAIARSLLATLAQASPETVDAWALLEATWPDLVVRDATALNRLYTAIHRLRAMGLHDVLIREEHGYRLTRVLVG